MSRIRFAGVRVDVTQADIDNGQEGSCYFCPIARALNRATFGTTWIAGLSELKRVGVWHEKRPTPRSCRRFIEDFDRGRPVKPFYFFIPRRK